jgi:hypothetical protein
MIQFPSLPCNKRTGVVVEDAAKSYKAVHYDQAADYNSIASQLSRNVSDVRERPFNA